ncbi:hypothetical protein AAG570_003315 [Ranatra chinensis]|uniref:Major facilitator superfamily associated domain-containing protein n=1 Tax=Ranatra chinensis TaxID=642074 RepID=A0ABD0Y707_9HEMI
MSLGTIGYNVSNSISDAICFDILGDGEQRNYGQQRVWGTIGFGLSALVGGYLIDKTSYGLDVKNYTPAYALAVGLMLLDVATCCKLKFPPLPKSESIVRSITSLVKQPAVLTFLIYAMLVGICDAAMIFYLLWYLEDLAKVTNQIENIKLLQGLTVACETLFGEVVFFYISGYVISRLGYGHCLTLCFALYALRLGLVSALPSPWWILPVETFMQGPTYALCYATIVGYASQVSPPGTSATMQGLVAGMDDGIGKFQNE